MNDEDAGFEKEGPGILSRLTAWPLVIALVIAALIIGRMWGRADAAGKPHHESYPDDPALLATVEEELAKATAEKKWSQDQQLEFSRRVAYLSPDTRSKLQTKLAKLVNTNAIIIQAPPPSPEPPPCTCVANCPDPRTPATGSEPSKQRSP